MDYADYILEGEQNPRCKQLCSFLFAPNIMPRTVSLITGVRKLHLGQVHPLPKGSRVRGLGDQSPLVGHLDCFTFLGPSLQPCGPGVLGPWGAVHFQLPHGTPAPGPLHKLLYCLSLSYLLGVPP